MRGRWRRWQVYGLAAVAAFAVEVLIALFVDDRFVRPYVGDSLAVVLVYLGLRTVTPLRVAPAVVIAVAVGTVLEFGQLFNVLGLLGLSHNRLARVVLGTFFEVGDLVAYAVGGAVVLAVEAWRKEALV